MLANSAVAAGKDVVATVNTAVAAAAAATASAPSSVAVARYGSKH